MTDILVCDVGVARFFFQFSPRILWGLAFFSFSLRWCGGPLFRVEDGSRVGRHRRQRGDPFFDEYAAELAEYFVRDGGRDVDVV